ncbi:MAG TPA: hypothetical protein VK192_09210 [Sphingomicrobium sp.]|jgi:hypothetical protein|nr:hypothetical protein [Sphingomicrobium sp.]
MATRAIPSDRPYVAAIVTAILLVVLVGFSRSFYLLPAFGSEPEWAAKERIFYLHGTVFSLWFALLACQTYLVRARSVRLHRKLGYAGAGLGAAIVVVGTYVALRAANRASGFMGVSLPPQQFLTVPLAGMVLFAAFMALGVVNRRKPASHKRLMLLASISLLGAPIARLTAMFPQLPIWLDAVVFTAFTIAMGYWDVETRGKIRPETQYGGPAIVLATLAAVPIGSTVAWQNVASWMMGFVGPP